MFYEKGTQASIIRNNCEYVVLFENFGNKKKNRQIAESIGFGTEYNEALKFTSQKRYGYVIFSSSPKLPNDKFRVCSNIFGERSDLSVPIFFT